MTTHIYHDENGFYFKEFDDEFEKMKYDGDNYYPDYAGTEEDFLTEAVNTLKALKDKNSEEFKEMLRL